MFYRLLTFSLVMVLCHGQSVWARTIDMMTVCDDCHTMHNKLDGAEVVAGGAQPALLSSTCYGCHTGSTNATNRKPIVLHDSDPQYGATGTGGGARNSLAGGDFWWVSNGFDLKGHNVAGFSTQTARVPPGNPAMTSFNTLSCAGTSGCHGKDGVGSDIAAMYQTHHNNEVLPIDGSTLEQSFRFLDGVAGIEDSDYELTVDAATNDHNQYFGIVRNIDGVVDTHTISYLCAKCHGDFHTGASPAGLADGVLGTVPWLRHPVDFDMNGIGGEYADYGGAGTNAYNVATPLASDDLSLGIAVSQVLQGSGDAIITCLTCHRAHGSPYDYSLRWDYQSWPAGGYNGCGDCHTTKD